MQLTHSLWPGWRVNGSELFLLFCADGNLTTSWPRGCVPCWQAFVLVLTQSVLFLFSFLWFFFQKYSKSVKKLEESASSCLSPEKSLCVLNVRIKTELYINQAEQETQLYSQLFVHSETLGNESITLTQKPTPECNWVSLQKGLKGVRYNVTFGNYVCSLEGFRQEGGQLHSACWGLRALGALRIVFSFKWRCAGKIHIYEWERITRAKNCASIMSHLRVMFPFFVRYTCIHLFMCHKNSSHCQRFWCSSVVQRFCALPMPLTTCRTQNQSD